jgi:hypothetical protein
VVEAEEHQEVAAEEDVVAEDAAEDQEEEPATPGTEWLNIRDYVQPSACTYLTMVAKEQPTKCATHGRR